MAKVSYGGQAVMEGVMMQGPHGKAIAVRKSDGSIVYKITEQKPLKERHPILGWPLIRGCVSFVMSLVSGMRDLTWSAAQNDTDEDEALSTRDIVLAVLLAAVLVLVFFVALPVFLATWAHQYIGDFGRSLLEGVLRGGLFLGYLLAIRRLPDIRRLFAYHGAEHKSINTLEAGAPLTPEAAKEYSRIHIRCGTSFILMVMILMILVFTFVGQTGAFARVGIKILLMPVIAGVSYELYRLPLKYPHNPVVRALVAPGLAMQKLTTEEPTAEQLEIAIAALSHVPGFAEDYPETAAKLAAWEKERAETEAISSALRGETATADDSDVVTVAAPAKSAETLSEGAATPAEEELPAYSGSDRSLLDAVAEEEGLTTDPITVSPKLAEKEDAYISDIPSWQKDKETPVMQTLANSNGAVLVGPQAELKNQAPLLADEDDMTPPAAVIVETN